MSAQLGTEVDLHGPLAYAVRPGGVERASAGRRVPLVGAVLAVLVVVRRTVAPRLPGVTDELIFRGALVDMHRGRGFYPAYRDALAAQGVPGSQVRAFRLPTEFLLLRPFPVSSYRWLAAVAVLATVALCWRLVRDASPVVQAVVLVGTAVWLAELVPAVYLYAEIWALPWFVLGLVAIREERWALAAVALALAVATRELYLPALLVALVVAPAGRRRPFVVGLGAVAILGAVHWTLAGRELVEVGNEAPFAAFSGLAASVRSLLSPRPGQVLIALPIGILTVVGAAGTARRWATDPAAKVLGVTALAVTVATLYGGRVYWPLLTSPVLLAFVGAALPARPARPARHPVEEAPEAGAATWSPS